MTPSRREFLRGGVVIAAAAAMSSGSRPAMPAEPIERTSGNRLKLSCAAYSFRDQLTGKDSAHKMTLDDFIRICAESGCDAIEPTSYYFPAEITDKFLADLKGKAFASGLDISGTAIRSDYCVPAGPKRDEQVAHTCKWIDYAVFLGAPFIRVFAGGNASGDMDAQRDQCIETLKPCLDYAAQKGVFLAIENHGGIVFDADNLLTLVRLVESPWFAINLDSGNFHTSDPYGDFARCVPYSVTVQFKTEIAPAGGQREPADPKRIVQILRDGGYRGYIALEYEGAAPAPEAIPKWLGILRKAIDESQ